MATFNLASKMAAKLSFQSFLSSLGLVLLGDSNDFDISNILSSHNLKQVVKVPTRGTAIFDLIITNQPNLYEPLQVLAPLGSSDHNIVTW